MHGNDFEFAYRNSQNRPAVNRKVTSPLTWSRFGQTVRIATNLLNEWST
jgi:hypothetical protein